MYSCLYVRGVDMYCRCWEGEMSTWLHDGWIEANRPKSTGRGECITSTDGVAMG